MPAPFTWRKRKKKRMPRKIIGRIIGKSVTSQKWNPDSPVMVMPSLEICSGVAPYAESVSGSDEEGSFIAVFFTGPCTIPSRRKRVTYAKHVECRAVAI
jgi:hypothetical protein